MNPLSPEQRDYKEKTLDQLMADQSKLEAELSQESRPDGLRNIQGQLDEIRAHIDRLQRELATGSVAEAVADQMCVRVAQALAKEKFYLAKRYINKLETIEPFYPSLDLLRAEAEAGRASRRTRSIAQGNALPYGAAAFPRSQASASIAAGTEAGSASLPPVRSEVAGQEKEGLSRFFQFHIVASCLVILLIVCVVFGVGGFTVLQWLLEGG
jgi:hypothetical protein